jgi:two-component system, NtrC family, response regulator AlgB
LDAQVKAGRFRQDLLYRLNVFQIELPPLRERAEDIVALANRFLAFFARKNNRQFLGFTEEAKAALQAYAWPGNIRELQNRIERAAILTQATEIGIAELDLKTADDGSRVQIGDPITLDKLDEAHIRMVLASSKSLEEASRILGIDAATLWRRRKKYRI